MSRKKEQAQRRGQRYQTVHPNARALRGFSGLFGCPPTKFLLFFPGSAGPDEFQTAKFKGSGGCQGFVSSRLGHAAPGGGGVEGYSRQFRIGVCRQGSQTLPYLRVENKKMAPYLRETR